MNTMLEGSSDWARAINCLDLARDLGSLRERPAGQVLAPLYLPQRDLLIELLEREFARCEPEVLLLIEVLERAFEL
jgi:hypothetical protein